MTAGSSMLAMILSWPPQRAQPSISMPNTRLSRRAQLSAGGQPGVLDVALDQAATFQHLADTRGDLLDKPLQLVRAGGRHLAELG